MITKADAFEMTLGEINQQITLAREGDREDVLNVCEQIIEAMGMLNMRLAKLEAAG